MRRRGLVRIVRASNEQRRYDQADNRFQLYLRPNGRGSAVVRDECNEEEQIVAAPAQTFAPGTSVLVGSNAGQRSAGAAILSPPPPGRSGGGAFAQEYPTPGELDAVAAPEANPAVLAAGVSGQVVIVTGYGFRESPLDIFEAVVWNATARRWDLDPEVTVTGVTWTSSAQVEITFAATAAAAGRLVNLSVRRAG